MKRLGSGLCATLAALTLAACGGHGDHDSGGNGASGAGKPTDAAFVNDMTPHHESAIEMAALARKHAEHDEIRDLAADITAAQEREIETMRSVESELGDAAHGDHHMSGDEHARGMDHDAADLRGAKPFDRAFIDMMIPHHEGAVTMAEEQIANGKNPRLRRLAEDIVTTQRREIAQMREWRAEWYGGRRSHGGGHQNHP